MSGTSLDGVDAALIDFSQPNFRQLGQHFLPIDAPLKSELLALHLPGHNELHRVQIASNQLARLYADAVMQLLSSTNLARQDVRAIGCHGQTIRHCPEQGYTLQIGNAALLAELTGIAVISDFRSRDIAAGGQGAPLVPAFHHDALRHQSIYRVIVNIGGISNLTNLTPSNDTTGFDCGPGNLLMDAWCLQHLDKAYDKDGRWAATGSMLPKLLDTMLAEPFFARPPPKSSGRDLFNLPWLTGKLQGNESPQDVQATLLELTCLAIARSIQQYCAGVEEIYLCGGGAHNQALRKRLAELMPDCVLDTTNALGVDGDYLEAIAFAWLARQHVNRQPANLPQVTGAAHPCVLGAHYPA
jgi:anhydro-N-acetylmuramic acid kinase